MNNVFDIIYTYDGGQTRVTIPFADLPSNFFESKRQMLDYLLFSFNAIETSRNAKESVVWRIRELVKISTCVYSDTFVIPEWYKDWDGKFWQNDLV